MADLLRDLLMRCTKRELQYGALDLLPRTTLPGGSKTSIVESLIGLSHRRRDVCVYFLRKARKSTIDLLIPRRGKTKSMSMDTFLYIADVLTWCAVDWVVVL